jgi:hypothetical protein
MPTKKSDATVTDKDLPEDSEQEENVGFQPRAAEFQRSETKVMVLTVLIDRDAATKIPTTIYEWEWPILEEIHGEGQVIEIDARPSVTTMTAGEAYQQLLTKYKHKEAHATIKGLWRNAAALGRKTGLPMNDTDNTRGGSAPPAIDFSGDANQSLLGNSTIVEPATTRRL